ncbi:MAG: hypothetical protein ACYDHP_05925 [Ferrimicrobium sp.]
MILEALRQLWVVVVGGDGSARWSLGARRRWLRFRIETVAGARGHITAGELVTFLRWSRVERAQWRAWR